MTAEWVVPAISGASGVLGALVGAGAAYGSQRASARQGGRRDLVVAAARYTTALEIVRMELTALPRSTRPGALVERVINDDRTPAIQYVLLWLQNKTLGRDAQQAIRELLRAADALTLVAPLELLPAIERINQLLGAALPKSREWQRSWNAARGDLIQRVRELTA